MRLTRFGLHGAVFYLVMLGAFFASPYSNLFFLLLGFLTVLGLCGALAARRNLQGITASLLELDPLPTDARLQVPVEVRAPGRTRFQLSARLALAGGHELVGRLDLLDTRGTLTLKASDLPRGCHAVERLRLESTHPFGLVRVMRAVTAPRELVVYPAPGGRLTGRSAADSLDELLGRGDPSGGDLQPCGLRDHREGDGMRAIHWRASARRDRLVVQEWEGGRGQGLEVVLDRRCASADELDEALTTLSAMVHLARTGKESLRIHSQGISETFGEGQRPWREALRFLAQAELLPATDPAPPATSPSVARLPRAQAEVGCP